MYQDYGLFIDGAWRPAKAGGTREGGSLGIHDYLEPKYVKMKL